MNDDVITPPTGVDDLLPLGKPIIVGLEVLGDVDGTVLGNDLNPDDVRIVITDVGTSGKPGDIIAGDNGGVFVLNPRGALDFFDNGDFDDLALGEYRTTSVTYTIGFAGPSSMFDVMLLQDLSGSFGDDIANVQAQYPLLIEDLTTNFDAQFGVASFVDKPILPFGSAGDYVYRTDVGITDDVSAIETAVSKARQEGVMIGMPTFDANDAIRWIEKGVQWVLVDDDYGFLTASVDQIAKEISDYTRNKKL